MHSRASDDDDDETSAGGYVAHRRRLRAATPKTRTTFAVDRRPRPERSAGYIARRSSALRESGVRARARCVKISSSPAAVDDRESAYALRGCLRPRQRFRSTFVFETYVALTPGEYGYSRGFGGVRSSHSTACRYTANALTSTMANRSKRRLYSRLYARRRSPETRTPYEYGRAAGPLASTDGFRSFGRSGEYATRALSRAPVGLAVPSLPRDTTRRTRVLTARSPLRDGSSRLGETRRTTSARATKAVIALDVRFPACPGLPLARSLACSSVDPSNDVGSGRRRDQRGARANEPADTAARHEKYRRRASAKLDRARPLAARSPVTNGKDRHAATSQYTETTPRRTQLGRRRSKSTFVDAERLVYIVL
ncbi:hypothetical protein V9T40_009843 [Parthenolecanium corni]|uniref:Uncharacterized protein n=1 Tax=Parthenolecanium corni TaxID=536013 RepID=A0AAN9TGI7_9HEMI